MIADTEITLQETFERVSGFPPLRLLLLKAARVGICRDQAGTLKEQIERVEEVFSCIDPSRLEFTWIYNYIRVDIGMLSWHHRIATEDITAVHNKVTSMEESYIRSLIVSVPSFVGLMKNLLEVHGGKDGLIVTEAKTLEQVEQRIIMIAIAIMCIFHDEEGQIGTEDIAEFKRLHHNATSTLYALADLLYHSKRSIPPTQEDKAFANASDFDLVATYYIHTCNDLRNQAGF